MNSRRIEIYAAAVFALFFAGLVVYNPNLSLRQGGEVTFLSLNVHSPYSLKIAKRLLVPGSSPDEPEWLTSARSDPDPRIRLNAIRAWAQHSTERVDAITYSLFDPDDSVRAQARMLLQNLVVRQ